MLPQNAGCHLLLKISEVLDGESPTDQCTERLTLTDILRIKYPSLVSCGLLFSANTRTYLLTVVVLDSLVGIATCYGLDGPGIESSWGRDFPHPSRPHPRPTKPPVQWVPGYCRGWRGTDHPHPSSVKVKETVEPYLYTLSVPSWGDLDLSEAILTGISVS